MYWAILIVSNIPIYLFIGWIVFDTKGQAADTIFDTIVAILKIIFIPRIVRVVMDMDESGALGIFEIGLFVVGCAMMVFGEHFLLQRFIFAWEYW